MIYTKYANHRNADLMREVDNNPNATDLERELAKRLASRLDPREYETTSRPYRANGNARG